MHTDFTTQRIQVHPSTDLLRAHRDRDTTLAGATCGVRDGGREATHHGARAQKLARNAAPLTLALALLLLLLLQLEGLPSCGAATDTTHVWDWCEEDLSHSGAHSMRAISINLFTSIHSSTLHHCLLTLTRAAARTGPERQIKTLVPPCTLPLEGDMSTATTCSALLSSVLTEGITGTADSTCCWEGLMSLFDCLSMSNNKRVKLRISEYNQFLLHIKPATLLLVSIAMGLAKQ